MVLLVWNLEFVQPQASTAYPQETIYVPFFFPSANIVHSFTANPTFIYKTMNCGKLLSTNIKKCWRMRKKVPLTDSLLIFLTFLAVQTFLVLILHGFWINFNAYIVCTVYIHLIIVRYLCHAKRKDSSAGQPSPTRKRLGLVRSKKARSKRTHGVQCPGSPVCSLH